MVERPARLRRTHVHVLALLLAGVVWARPGHTAEPAIKLYVYLPNMVRPPMLQKVLSDALPGTTVLVFRHLRDFETNIAESPPDLVLSRRPLLEQHEGWTTVLQGLSNHRDDEPYVLVSRGQRSTLAAAPAAGIGVVDLLGKKAMPAFVAGLLGTKTPPPLTRVAQPEDLLPLLELGLVESVLMPARAVPTLREKTALDLRVVEPKDARMGLPALASLPGKAAAPDVQRKVAELPLAVKAMLGVDAWRRP